MWSLLDKIVDRNYCTPLVHGLHSVNNRPDLNVVFGVAGVVMMSFCVLKGGLRIPVGM